MKCSAPCSAVLRHSPSSWAAVVYTYAVANPIRGHKEVTMSTGAAALGRNPVSISTRFSLSMEMSRLTRDGTAEPVSRDQILRHEGGQGNIHFFPVQLTTCRTGNLTRLIHSLATIYMCDHTYIHYIHTYIMVTTRYSDQHRGPNRDKKLCDSISNGTDQYQNGSSNLLTPYREQPRSTRIVVASSRPAFSATKRTDYVPTPLVLINKSKFLKATHRTKIRKNEIPRSGPWWWRS